MARPTKEQQAEKARLLYKTAVMCWRMACPEVALSLKGVVASSVTIRTAVAQWQRTDPNADAFIKIWHEVTLDNEDARIRQILRKRQAMHKRARLQANRELKALELKASKRSKGRK